MEYASKNVANAGLATGIVGTALGAMNGVGGLAGLLGVRPNQPMSDGDRPVTRYEMGLYQEINAEKNENALLKAKMYADKGDSGLQQQIGAQAVWNATQMGAIQMLQGQIAQLYSMTKLTIPNGNINPGWGGATVIPTPVASIQNTQTNAGTGGSTEVTGG